MQFRDFFSMETQYNSKQSQNTLRTQFRETPAFQNLMEHAFYDFSCDGDFERKKNIKNGQEPDSASSAFSTKTKRKSQVHQVIDFCIQ